MKKAKLLLSIVTMIIGTYVPKFAIGQYNNLSKKQLISKIETIEKRNQKLEQDLKEKTGELEAIKKKAQSLKYAPEIDEMLNIEDTTIFNVAFKEFDAKSVHPRSREMYQWVSSIHELQDLVHQIEEKHLAIEKFNADLVNLPASTVKQLESLNNEIKEHIRTADKKREMIELSYGDMKKAFSLSQMDYYNGLVDKLNNFINLYFE